MLRMFFFVTGINDSGDVSKVLNISVSFKLENKDAADTLNRKQSLCLKTS
jgi:hypothetical protein